MLEGNILMQVEQVSLLVTPVHLQLGQVYLIEKRLTFTWRMEAKGVTPIPVPKKIYIQNSVINR